MRPDFTAKDRFRVPVVASSEPGKICLPWLPDSLSKKSARINPAEVRYSRLAAGAAICRIRAEREHELELEPAALPLSRLGASASTEANRGSTLEAAHHADSA